MLPLDRKRFTWPSLWEGFPVPQQQFPSYLMHIIYLGLIRRRWSTGKSLECWARHQVMGSPRIFSRLGVLGSLALAGEVPNYDPIISFLMEFALEWADSQGIGKWTTSVGSQQLGYQYTQTLILSIKNLLGIDGRNVNRNLFEEKSTSMVSFPDSVQHNTTSWWCSN